MRRILSRIGFASCGLTLLISFMAHGQTAAPEKKPVMLSSSSTKSKSNVKLAFVDVQAAILQTEEGKNARAAIETDAKPKRDGIMEQQKNLKQLEEDFLAQQAVLTDGQKRERQADFQKRFEQFQMAKMEFEKEFREKEMKETQKIFQKMAEIIEGIGKKGGYDLVFERSANALLYASAIDDLTPEVVAEYNKRHSTKKGK